MSTRCQIGIYESESKKMDDHLAFQEVYDRRAPVERPWGSEAQAEIDAAGAERCRRSGCRPGRPCAHCAQALAESHL